MWRGSVTDRLPLRTTNTSPRRAAMPKPPRVRTGCMPSPAFQAPRRIPVPTTRLSPAVAAPAITKCSSNTEPTKKGRGFGSPLSLLVLCSRQSEPQIVLCIGNKPRCRSVLSLEAPMAALALGLSAPWENGMSDFDRDDGVNRRKVLECMTWVGTGVLWTIAGGVPHSLGIMGEAQAQEAKGLTFLQISDSHVGFDKPANPNALGTLQEAVSKIIALPQKPAFMIHTGDISHLSLESQFDDADRIISQTKLDVHYVPGEHDFLDPEQKFYRERYGRGTKGAGWYSFDANGVHFIGLVNVVDLKAGGLGNLGNDQLEWLEADVKGRSASTPIVVFAHIPLWTVYPDWGWGTEDGARALSYLKKFGSVTVLNGHIHQVMQKVEGNVTFHTARSTAFPQPAPGAAPSPGPMKVPAEKLRSMLGITNVAFKQNNQPLAIIDSALES